MNPWTAKQGSWVEADAGGNLVIIPSTVEGLVWTDDPARNNAPGLIQADLDAFFVTLDSLIEEEQTHLSDVQNIVTSVWSFGHEADTAMLEQWVNTIKANYVDTGKVVWATVTEIYDEFAARAAVGEGVRAAPDITDEDEDEDENENENEEKPAKPDGGESGGRGNGGGVVGDRPPAADFDSTTGTNEKEDEDQNGGCASFETPCASICANPARTCVFTAVGAQDTWMKGACGCGAGATEDEKETTDNNGATGEEAPCADDDAVASAVRKCRAARGEWAWTCDADSGLLPPTERCAPPLFFDAAKNACVERC